MTERIHFALPLNTDSSGTLEVPNFFSVELDEAQAESMVVEPRTLVAINTVTELKDNSLYLLTTSHGRQPDEVIPREFYYVTLKGEQAVLQPPNPELQQKVVPAETVTIYGAVVMVIRQMRF